jgi:hypothetical protein
VVQERAEPAFGRATTTEVQHRISSKQPFSMMQECQNKLLGLVRISIVNVSAELFKVPARSISRICSLLLTPLSLTRASKTVYVKLFSRHNSSTPDVCAIDRALRSFQM